MKMKLDGYVVWAQEPWQDKPEFYWREFKPKNDSTKVVVCTQQIEVEVPDDFDPRAKQVEALESKKRELQANFAAAVNEINVRINSLLALESS